MDTWRQHYREALAGHLPAEALPTHARARLVAALHRAGLTDTEVAAHTRQTTYTAARIRNRLGLPPNQPSTTSTTRGAA